MDKKIFETIGRFFVRRAKLCLAVIGVLTVFFALGITRIQIHLGNESFVSTGSDVYKNTVTYEENFGGDGVYVLLEAPRDQLISRETAQTILAFTSKAKQIPQITGSIDYVDLLNELLESDLSVSMFGSGNLENAGLAQAIQQEISREDMLAIQQQMQQSLTPDQHQQIGAYSQSLLTEAQMQEMGAMLAQLGAPPTAEQQQQALQAVLTAEQHEAISLYTQSILTADQLAAMQAAVIQALPKVEEWSTETLQAVVFSDNGRVPDALGLLLPENGQYVLINLTTASGLDMEDSESMMKDLKALVRDTGLDDGMTVMLAGNHSIYGDIKGEVMGSMILMLVLSVVLMVVALYVVFPVRRRLTSLVCVLVGLIWTFGFMGWSGIPVSIATMATLPIIIGLGTDFGVQFHNRYEEEFKANGFDAEKAIINASRHIGPAVGIAVVLMAFSFLTMLLSKSPMMQQFGVVLAFGAVVCYVVEMILIFSLFALTDRKGKTVKTREISETKLSRFLYGYSGVVRKIALPILIVVVLLSGVGFWSDHKIKTETNMFIMIPQDMEGLIHSRELQEIAGSTLYLTFLAEGDDMTDQDVLAWLSAFGDRIKQNFDGVEGVTTLATALDMIGGEAGPSNPEEIRLAIDGLPPSMTRTLISSDHRYASIQVQIDPDIPSADQLVMLDDILALADAPAGVNVVPAGSTVLAVVGVDNISANTTLIKVLGVAILLVGLFLIYRRVKLAVFPILPIVFVLGFTPLVLLSLGLDYNPLTIALSCLVLGIGTEFTVLVMERYKEELDHGLSEAEAIRIAISKVGQAITASGLTVIIGFSTLLFVDFPVLREFGMTTLIDTTLCLLFALTILPALIFIFGRKKKRMERGS